MVGLITIGLARFTAVFEINSGEAFAAMIGLVMVAFWIQGKYFGADESGMIVEIATN